jgi:Bacterial protein of unknown function (DUF885)
MIPSIKMVPIPGSMRALLRDCRFIASIEMHTKGESIDDATQIFMKECGSPEPEARREAYRGTRDPGYINYTVGRNLEIARRLPREEGDKFFLTDFHDRVLAGALAPSRSSVRGRAIRSQILKAIGDPDTEEGLSLLRERSPLFQAASISPKNRTSPCRPSSAKSTKIFILDVSSPIKTLLSCCMAGPQLEALRRPADTTLTRRITWTTNLAPRKRILRSDRYFRPG